MLGADLVATPATHRSRARRHVVRSRSTGRVAVGRQLRAGAGAGLPGGRLPAAYGARRSVRLGAGGEARLDLVWREREAPETLTAWETEPCDRRRDARRYGARRGRAPRRRGLVPARPGARPLFFRFLLPLAFGASRGGRAAARATAGPSTTTSTSSAPARAAGRSTTARSPNSATRCSTPRPPASIPAAGDEIISDRRGAHRQRPAAARARASSSWSIRSGAFPRRRIPIHGISPEIVGGQPTIDEVLPAFHRFAGTRCWSATTSAFDMRFLKLKEAAQRRAVRPARARHAAAVGVVHPQRGIAPARGDRRAPGRAGGRSPHRARRRAGDRRGVSQADSALAQQGILTLGQARKAAQETYYARLRY